MRTLTLGQIEELENKEPIPRFVGTIRKVLDQKTDVGAYGQWWLQTLFVGEEGNANDLAVTWTGEDAFDSICEGKVYSFECTTDKKDKLVGVQREIRTDKKTGRVYKGVKVDNRSKIKLETGQPEPQVEELSVSEDWPEAPVNAPESPVPHSNGNGGINDARKHLMQAANLYVLCVRCVNNAIAGELPEVARTSEMFQAATGTLFIEASRSGFVQKMPSDKPL